MDFTRKIQRVLLVVCITTVNVEGQYGHSWNELYTKTFSLLQDNPEANTDQIISNGKLLRQMALKLNNADYIVRSDDPKDALDGYWDIQLGTPEEINRVRNRIRWYSLQHRPQLGAYLTDVLEGVVPKKKVTQQTPSSTVQRTIVQPSKEVREVRGKKQQPSVTTHKQPQLSSTRSSIASDQTAHKVPTKPSVNLSIVDSTPSASDPIKAEAEKESLLEVEGGEFTEQPKPKELLYDVPEKEREYSEEGAIISFTPKKTHKDSSGTKPPAPARAAPSRPHKGVIKTFEPDVFSRSTLPDLSIGIVEAQIDAPSTQSSRGALSKPEILKTTTVDVPTAEVATSTVVVGTPVPKKPEIVIRPAIPTNKPHVKPSAIVEGPNVNVNFADPEIERSASPTLSTYEEIPLPQYSEPYETVSLSQDELKKRKEKIAQEKKNTEEAIAALSLQEEARKRAEEEKLALERKQQEEIEKQRQQELLRNQEKAEKIKAEKEKEKERKLQEERALAEAEIKKKNDALKNLLQRAATLRQSLDDTAKKYNTHAYTAYLRSLKEAIEVSVITSMQEDTLKDLLNKTDQLLEYTKLAIEELQSRQEWLKGLSPADKERAVQTLITSIQESSADLPTQKDAIKNFADDIIDEVFTKPQQKAFQQAKDAFMQELQTGLKDAPAEYSALLKRIIEKLATASYTQKQLENDKLLYANLKILLQATTQSSVWGFADQPKAYEKLYKQASSQHQAITEPEAESYIKEIVQKVRSAEIILIIKGKIPSFTKDNFEKIIKEFTLFAMDNQKIATTIIQYLPAIEKADKSKPLSNELFSKRPTLKELLQVSKKQYSTITDKQINEIEELMNALFKQLRAYAIQDSGLLYYFIWILQNHSMAEIQQLLVSAMREDASATKALQVLSNSYKKLPDIIKIKNKIIGRLIATIGSQKFWDAYGGVHYVALPEKSPAEEDAIAAENKKFESHVFELLSSKKIGTEKIANESLAKAIENLKAKVLRHAYTLKGRDDFDTLLTSYIDEQIKKFSAQEEDEDQDDNSEEEDEGDFEEEQDDDNDGESTDDEGE